MLIPLTFHWKAILYLDLGVSEVCIKNLCQSGWIELSQVSLATKRHSGEHLFLRVVFSQNKHICLRS